MTTQYDLADILTNVVSITQLVEIITKCRSLTISHLNRTYLSPERVEEKIIVTEYDLEEHHHVRIVEFLKRNKKKYLTPEAFMRSRSLSNYGAYTSFIMFMARALYRHSHGLNGLGHSPCISKEEYAYELYNNFYYKSNTQRIIIHTTSPLSFGYDPETVLLF